MKQYIGSLLLTISVFQLYGQAIITDRPDQTESSSIVERGHFQIESGIVVLYQEDNSASEQQLLLPTTLFRYGLTDRFELRVVNQLERKNINGIPMQGISDLELGTKVQLLKKENINTEIALLSHLVLPTGTSEFSNNTFSTINKLSISHELNNQLGLGYNLGYDYLGVGIGDFTYSIALAIEVNDKVGLYIEPYGRWVDFAAIEANFDGGFTYLIHDNFQLDFSFGVGLNYTMNYLSIGFSWKTIKN